MKRKRLKGTNAEQEELRKYLSSSELAEACKAGTLTPEQKAGVLVMKNFDTVVKAEDSGMNAILFVISTEDLDRDSDTLAIKGWNLKNYKKNPVVQWAHDYYSPPIAKAVKVYAEDGKLKSLAEFTPQDMNPFGYMIYQMLKNKFLNATSVGFKAIDYEFVEESDNSGNCTRRGINYKKQELLEYSVVPIPANPMALVEARSIGIDTSLMKGWAERVLDEWDIDTETSLMLPKGKLEELRKQADGTNSVSFAMFSTSKESKSGEGDDMKLSWTCGMVGHEHKSKEEASACIDLVVLGLAKDGGRIAVKGKTFVQMEGEKEIGEIKAEFVKALDDADLLDSADKYYDDIIEALNATSETKDNAADDENSDTDDKDDGSKGTPVTTEDNASDENDEKDNDNNKVKSWEELSAEMEELLKWSPSSKSFDEVLSEFEALAIEWNKHGKKAPEFRYTAAAVLKTLPDLFKYDLATGELKCSLPEKKELGNEVFIIDEGLLVPVAEDAVGKVKSFTGRTTYAVLNEVSDSVKAAFSIGAFETLELAKGGCPSGYILAASIGTLDGKIVYSYTDTKAHEEEDGNETEGDEKDNSEEELNKSSSDEADSFKIEELEDLLHDLEAKVNKAIEGKADPATAEENDITEEELKSMLEKARDQVDRILMESMGKVA